MENAHCACTGSPLAVDPTPVAARDTPALINQAHRAWLAVALASTRSARVRRKPKAGCAVDDGLAIGVMAAVRVRSA